MYFSGRGVLPRQFRTARKVVTLVASHPGSMGIVDVSVEMDGVRTVEVDE